MTERYVARTVGDLIAILRDLDPETTIFTIEPPFTGVCVVPQGDGKAMIYSLRNTDEGRSYRAAKGRGPAYP